MLGPHHFPPFLSGQGENCSFDVHCRATSQTCRKKFGSNSLFWLISINKKKNYVLGCLVIIICTVYPYQELISLRLSLVILFLFTLAWSSFLESLKLEPPVNICTIGIVYRGRITHASPKEVRYRSKTSSQSPSYLPTYWPIYPSYFHTS